MRDALIDAIEAGFHDSIKAIFAVLVTALVEVGPDPDKNAEPLKRFERGLKAHAFARKTALASVDALFPKAS